MKFYFSIALLILGFSLSSSPLFSKDTKNGVKLKPGESWWRSLICNYESGEAEPPTQIEIYESPLGNSAFLSFASVVSGHKFAVTATKVEGALLSGKDLKINTFFEKSDGRIEVALTVYAPLKLKMPADLTVKLPDGTENKAKFVCELSNR